METFVTVAMDTGTLMTVPMDMGYICNCCQGYAETFIMLPWPQEHL